MLVVLAISFANCFGSVRIKPWTPTREETEAANLWNRSEPLNRELLKWNRGYIYPGDLMIFAYPEVGDELYRQVEKGDYPLGMSMDIIRTKPQKENYGYSGGENSNAVGANDNNEEPAAFAEFWEDLKSLPMWPWILLLIAAGIAIMMGKEQKAKKVNSERNSDPVKAGPAQVEGGVNDQSAHFQMKEKAERLFPSATLVITNIRRGHLSGPGEIFYAGSDKPKEIILENVPAYSGEILVNGKEQTIYFLQGCGNDARSGNFMSGKEFTFTPDVLINRDGSERPLDTSAPVIEVVEEKVEVAPEKKVIVLSQRTELDKLVIAQAQLAQEFMSSNNAHKVTMKTTLENGMSSEITLEAKIEPKTQPQQKNESSEGTKK